MNKGTIVIMPEQMKALARYEATFDQYIKDPEFDDGQLSFPEKYRMTLDDLLAALKNVFEKDPTVREFGENWYYPLMELEEAFGIDEACDTAEDDELNPVKEMIDDCVRGLPLTDRDVFEDVWSELEDIWIFEEDAHVCDTDHLKELISDIEIFLTYKDMPIREREFSDHQKKSFIGFFENDDRVKDATEIELQLCRKFTDELCEKDQETALRLKGYACYGGNRLYECDWGASRDCMIRLFEKTDDPMYANTLGYIYYYGRCTGGVPEYEKAFEMFSVAAANGYHEGIYKLADMYRHGYACKKSYRTARALYGMVYDDCYKKFIEGAADGSFADAALRMGNVYLKGIGEPKMPDNAYYYYLQAGYASKLRAERSDFFGNTTVAVNIQKALYEARAELPDDFFKDHIKMSAPLIFWELVEDGYKATLSLTRQKDGIIKVSVSRIPKYNCNEAKPVLLTYPEINFCKLVTGIDMTAYGVKTSFEDNTGTSYKYDFVEWNDTDCRIDFYYDGTPVGWILCDEYRLYPDKKETPSGKQLKLVSVAFQPGGRTYDYLCDIPNINPGDKVIVIGYDGETEVEVRSVFIGYESELGFPVEKYKKVVRKVKTDISEEENISDSKTTFRYNSETGILEAWRNGKKTGEVITMGDLIIKEENKASEENLQSTEQIDTDKSK